MWKRKSNSAQRPASSTTSRQTANVRRLPRGEQLESRMLMAANPIHVGVVYLETDYLETDSDAGNDSQPDRFILSFNGGAQDTELSELRISLDKDSDGLTVGDSIYDTTPGGRGKAGAHGFRIARTESATGGNITATAEVADGGTELIVRLSGFKAGDRLEFTVDVDEITRLSSNLDTFNSRLDVITSGQEFQDSIFNATFKAPHFEAASADTIFLNDYGNPSSEFALRLPPDEGTDLDSRPNRSAAALATTTQVPKPISISGTVWVDDDLNLRRDANESTVPGVQVSLWKLDNSGKFVDTGLKQTTDANGKYLFATSLGLMPGEYQVNETQPAGLFSVGAVAGQVAGQNVGRVANDDVITSIQIPLGDTQAINYDFAEARPAQLAGFVYRDDNDNGRKDPSEQGIPGIKIRLVPVNTIAPKSPAETTTGSDGSYSFTELPPGRYEVVEVTQPTNLTDGRDSAGTVDGRPTGTADEPGDAVRQIDLAGGGRGIDYNFGELPLGFISGGVFLAAPGEDCGDRSDSKSTPRAGVVVELQGPRGVFIARVITGVDGQYRFDNVPKGTYSIIETTPNGLLDGMSHVGRIDGIQVGTSQDGGSLREIVLPAGKSGVEYDFCEAAPAKLSGFVYHDASNDGRRDTVEEPIADTLIELVNASGSVVASTRTDANGAYTFEGVLPGTYSIRQLQPTGYLDGIDTAGTIAGVVIGSATNPGDLITGVILRQGQSGIEYNFGELRTASIAGRVHVDDDGDCVYDSGELLLSGITIRLLDSSEREIASTKSDSEGRYSFAGIAPGNYIIVEEQPAGYFEGGATPGSAGGRAENASRIGSITLTSGQVAVDYDFCERPPAEISGFVFIDRNEDCLRDDGELPLSGVRVELIDSAGRTVGATTTDATGSYRFTDLPEGSYTLRETQPTGFFQGGQTAGSGGGDASRDDIISSIPIGFGDRLTQYNFCELEPSSIAGQVFVDIDDDCVPDDNESRIPNVSIQLYDGAGRLVAETRTNSSGRYQFDNLPPGRYRIVEIQPDGFYGGNAIPGSGGGRADGSDSITEITIGPGGRFVDYNFCEGLPGTISGQVFVDKDDDCVPDEGESPISNVAIQLYDRTGRLVAETRTDSTGHYQFDNLPPGQYRIVEIQPDGFFGGNAIPGSGGGRADGSDSITEITIGPGGRFVDYNFCEGLPGTISGQVFVDKDDDCVPDEGESPISNVAIQLYDGTGRLVGETRTDSTGHYQFDNLPPGQYRIVEIQPDGFFGGNAIPGSGGGRADGSDSITDITIGPNGRLVEYNFCEGLPGSISGQVWRETDLNRRRDSSDASITGVTIQLLNQQGVVIASRQTDSEGRYRFADLKPSTYSVRELQPTGLFHGGQIAGSSGGIALIDDLISNIVLPVGADAINNDFAEFPPAKISGNVFQDGKPVALSQAPQPSELRNYRDGVYTVDDTAIGGVVLELRNVLGQPFTADRALPGAYPAGPIRVVTAADGSYEFAGLRPGSYHVYQLQPKDFIDSLDTAGTTGGIAVNVGDIEKDTKTLAFVRTLAANPATNPAADAILNILLTAGGESKANNFSEIVIESPVPPILPPPLAPNTVSLTPAPFVSTPKIIGTGEIRSLRPPLAADGEYEVTWHLSVINGGFPRGNGSQGGATRKVSAPDFRINFKEGEKTGGRWTFFDQTGKPIELGYEITLGESKATPLSGDFNGDGVDEVAIFSAGQWFVDLNGNGKWDAGDMWLRLGTLLDRPVVGDWDGDGKDDIGIFGPQWQRDPEAIVRELGLPDPDNQRRRKAVQPVSNRKPLLDKPRYLRRGDDGPLRADAIDHVFRYGEQPDSPITGDWNGDGIDSVAVFRSGEWMLDADGDGRWVEADAKIQFGEAGDEPIVGDWNGDGIDDLGVIRGDVWIIDSDGDRRLTGNDKQVRIEKPSEDAKPVIGDWDGDGTDELGWYRQAG